MPVPVAYQVQEIRLMSDAAQNRKKTKAAVSRKEILATAARMMKKKGYADTSLRELAATVGMKAGSLYYHFPSKDELVLEVMRLGVELVEQAVSEELAKLTNASPRERLSCAIRVHLETFLSESDFTSAHIRCHPFVPQEIREKLNSCRRSYDRIWEHLVKDFSSTEASDQELRYLRLSIIGALNYSLEWFNPERDEVEKYVAVVARFLE